jgi:MerR family mercuric resistance operon transcriptional regulator
MSDLTSGQLAEGAGVGIETIRYYERKGLLLPPARSLAGYRRFPVEAVDRLRFIRQAQHLGFSLKEIQELLSLRIDPNASCAEVRQRAQAKIGEIEQRLRGLQRMREVLWRLIEACGGRGPATACPILEALEAPENVNRADLRKKKSRKGLNDEP